MVAFSSSTSARQAVFERHGKAVEPLPVVNLPGLGADLSKPSNLEQPDKKDAYKGKEKEAAKIGRAHV